MAVSDARSALDIDHLLSIILSFLPTRDLFYARLISRGMYSCCQKILLDTRLPQKRWELFFDSGTQISFPLGFRIELCSPFLFTSTGCDVANIPLVRRKKQSRLFRERLVVINDVDDATQLVAWMCSGSGRNSGNSSSSGFSLQHCIIPYLSSIFHLPYETPVSAVYDLRASLWAKLFFGLKSLSVEMWDYDSVEFYHTAFSSCLFSSLTVLKLEASASACAWNGSLLRVIATDDVCSWNRDTGKRLETVILDCRLLDERAETFHAFFDWACNAKQICVRFCVGENQDEMLFDGLDLPKSWNPSQLDLSVEYQNHNLHDYQFPTPLRDAWLSRLKKEGFVLNTFKTNMTRYDIRLLDEIVPPANRAELVRAFVEDLPPLVYTTWWENVTVLGLRTQLANPLDCLDVCNAMQFIPHLKNLRVNDVWERIDRKEIPIATPFGKIEEEVPPMPLPSSLRKQVHIPFRPPRLARLVFSHVDEENAPVVDAFIDALTLAPWKSWPRVHCLVSVDFQKYDREEEMLSILEENQKDSVVYTLV